jgi:hypothetical protein
MPEELLKQNSIDEPFVSSENTLYIKNTLSYKVCMGEIFRFGNTIVRIWSNDHKPPHVEVFSPSMKNWEAKAKFRIQDLVCIENSGFSEKDIQLIQRFLEKRREKLAEKWREIHGED